MSQRSPGWGAGWQPPPQRDRPATEVATSKAPQPTTTDAEVEAEKVDPVGWHDPSLTE